MLPAIEPLEAASGMVFGSRRNPTSETGIPSDLIEVHPALEEILVPALSRSPCMVAFSGGTDSSVILALATRVAREHGLPDPIPVTLRFEHPRTWETEWQETMIRHLDLSDWTLLPYGHELEALGEIARAALGRHGLYWPANAHVLVPLVEAARGGALLTGNGGDELFSRKMGGRIPLRSGVRARPLRRAVLLSTIYFLPEWPRIRLQYRGLLRLPWLTPRARREVRRQFMGPSEPPRSSWKESLQQLLDSRYLELALGIFSALARDADVLLAQPFLDPRFIGAAVQEAPLEGFRSRNMAIAALFGDLLPTTMHRRTKAVFTDILWGPQSRSFAERPGPLSLDPDLVDHDAIRRVWARPRPDFRALTPLQAAWVAESARSEEPQISHQSRTLRADST